jgi:cytochrome P450
VSTAEVSDFPVTRQPLVPPYPPRAPESMGRRERMRLVRESTIATWGQKAYEEDVLQGRFVNRSSFTLNTPEAIRHVLVDNYENYTRTAVAFRLLRPMLGQGLLTAEGRAWKHQRRTLAPAFTPRAVSMLVPLMLAVTDETIAALKGKVGQPIDLYETMQRMSLEIASRTMFSFGMERHGATLRDFWLEYAEKLGRPDLLDIALPLRWPTPQDFRRARFRKRWTAFVAMLMAERRAAGKQEGAPPRDLFELMEAARDPETGKAFTDEQLGDEVATMILAGHENTASSLFWALYLLALDPATQDELAAEVKAQPAGAPLDVDRLKFTRAVIDETMRLYPAVFLTTRVAYGADTVAGLKVAPKDVILIAPWLLHRHEKLWRDPNAFIPQRFMAPNPPPNRFVYMPFGAGPRVCIGAHFAIVEATLALAKLIGEFRVELTDTVPVIPVAVVTIHPDRAPVFVIKPR